MGRQGRRRRLLVPLALLDQLLEVVAHRLLVERRLATAGLVALARPEARAVRREHLIDDHERAIRQRAELEFRVGDDDARLLRHLAATLIDREAALAQLVRELVADAT